MRERARPQPAAEEILIEIKACGVCRTDVHILDGELTDPKLPLIPGHEIVGTVVEKGAAVDRYEIGDRVGVPWLGWTYGMCEYCRSDRENLCDRARFTGYQIDGGYAELTVADQRYCFAIPSGFDDTAAAPLLCAGLIVIGPCGWQARENGSAFTVLVLRRISWLRWQGIRDVRSSPSASQATARRRSSPVGSVRFGPAAPMKGRPRRSMRP